MSGIVDFFHDTVQKVTGQSSQQHADNIKKALSLPSDAESSKTLGAAPEPYGRTITGGRRRKTRREKRRKSRRARR